MTHGHLESKAEKIFPMSRIESFTSYEQKRAWFYAQIRELYSHKPAPERLQIALRAIEELRPENPGLWDRLRDDLLSNVRRSQNGTNHD